MKSNSKQSSLSSLYFNIPQGLLELHLASQEHQLSPIQTPCWVPRHNKQKSYETTISKFIVKQDKNQWKIFKKLLHFHPDLLLYLKELLFWKQLELGMPEWNIGFSPIFSSHPGTVRHTALQVSQNLRRRISRFIYSRTEAGQLSFLLGNETTGMWIILQK